MDNIDLYANNLYEAKYEVWINKRESTELKHFNDPKDFIEYLNDMQDVHENSKEYNIVKNVK